MTTLPLMPEPLLSPTRVNSILRCFNLTTRPLQISPLGKGHINLSLRVDYPTERYLLQRINERVFPEPWVVVENSWRVTRHLQTKSTDSGEAMLVPEMIRAAGGCSWMKDEAGHYWRLQRYVARSRVLQRLENKAQAHAAGRAFGHFQKLLLDFPVAELAPAIPHFHRLSCYLEELDRVRPEGQPPTRSAKTGELKDELAAIDRRRLAYGQVSVVHPVVIHGDCKLDNLLFERAQDRVSAVVDLDTVMLGDSVWDFGDLVRSAAVTGPEDRVSVDFSVPLFEQLARGFLKDAADWIPAARRNELVQASGYMAYMLAIRFLTDYLKGNVYFNTRYPRQNLMRARSQLKTLEKIEQQETVLCAVLKKI